MPEQTGFEPREHCPEQTGRKVEPNFDLPQGFELREDCDHFVYLYYKAIKPLGKSVDGEEVMITITEAVAVFNAQASPEAIINKCENYLERRGFGGLSIVFCRQQ